MFIYFGSDCKFSTIIFLWLLLFLCELREEKNLLSTQTQTDKSIIIVLESPHLVELSCSPEISEKLSCVFNTKFIYREVTLSLKMRNRYVFPRYFMTFRFCSFLNVVIFLSIGIFQKVIFIHWKQLIAVTNKVRKIIKNLL